MRFDRAIITSIVHQDLKEGMLCTIKDVLQWQHKAATMRRAKHNNETTPVWRHVCVHTFGYCYFHVHDKNDIVKIRMREYDQNNIEEF